MLSGNRNFEGRIHPQVRANYLASPPLVVAYALAGRMDVDLTTEPLGTGSDGKPVYLREIWPSNDRDRGDDGARASATRCSQREYADVFKGDENWREAERCRERALRVGSGVRVRQEAAVLRRDAGAAAAAAGRARRARDRRARRLGHDRSHLAGGQHREEQSGRRSI